MARKDPQINIRLSEELKQKLHEKAEINGNSVNAEIIERLERTIIAETPPTEILSASQARRFADQSAEDGFHTLLSTCIKEINNAAKAGSREAFVQTGFDYIDDTIEYRIITPVEKKLEELGYIVSFSDECFTIRF